MGFQLIENSQMILFFFLHVFLMQFQKLNKDCIDGKSSIADSSQQVVFRSGIHLFGYTGQAAGLIQFLPVMPQTFAFPFQCIRAFQDIFFPVFLFKPAAYFRAAFRTANDFQPVQAGFPCFGRDDFDNITVFEFIIERYDFAINLGPHTMMADFRMNAVSKINGNRSLGKVDDITPRREDKDFIGKCVELQGIDKFFGIARILPFQKIAQPPHFFIKFILSGIGIAFLVPPVCSDTVFGYAMHLPCTYLYFHRLPAGPDDRRMQRLVIIGLRHGNVIFETVWQRLPQTVHDAEDTIAVLDRIDNDTDGIQVVYLTEVPVIFFHFFINTVKMFGPAIDFKFYV